MKDVSNSHRVARPSAYPKKKPSPYGITKSSKRQSPVYGHSPIRKTPRAKVEVMVQRQRYLHLTLRRDGVFLEEEYHEEIRAYMHEMEDNTMSSLSSMDQQPEIRWHMRPCLVDFIVELHFSFRLRPETLYLSINIVDRYVSKRVVYVKHYQLVGCAALWIAAKFEDAKERVPTVHDLTQMCQQAYDESAFLQMEGHVLATIQWILGHPTAEAWLRFYCNNGSSFEDQKVQHVARFLMEITLFYREFVPHRPSDIALGALTLARYLCGRPRRAWEQTEGSNEVINLLDARLSHHANDLSEVLVKKYSYAYYTKAATFVLQFYLQGGRYQRPALVLPMTPVRAYSPQVCTPMSVSTTASDFSDDMPVTPSSPILSSDAFSGSYMSDDKENLPSPKFEPVMNKSHVEQVPEQFLPHDFVLYQRQALHNLNVTSPRPAMVS